MSLICLNQTIKRTGGVWAGGIFISLFLIAAIAGTSIQTLLQYDIFDFFFLILFILSFAFTVVIVATMITQGKKGITSWRIHNITATIFFVVSLFAVILIPNYLIARAQGSMRNCKSNLKNIGTALEIYSTDNYGRYPRELKDLIPDYIYEIPLCPAAEDQKSLIVLGICIYRYKETTYSYVCSRNPDAFTMCCGYSNIHRN